MDEYQRAVVNRLKTARGHLGGVIDMVGQDAYCPEVMKQLSAVQGLLEGTSRVVLRHHLEGCVARAMRDGRTEPIVDELMETLKFDRHVLRSTPPAAAEQENTMAVETISVPEIHCDHCKASIEGALAPMDGVSAADVNIAARQVTVTYDPEFVDRNAIVDAIVDQGYEVPVEQ